MIHVMQRQSREALVSAVGWGHVMLLGPRNLGIRGRDHMHMVPIHMADGIRARSHRSIIGGGSRGICTSDAVLSSSALSGSSTASTFTTVSWSRRGRRSLVKLLLVSQEQISPSKASCAFRALERFLLGVGTFMTFQMFQSGK